MSKGIMHRCGNPACGEYTLHDACPVCGTKASDPRPAKFSPEDHYGQYRRDLKRLEAQEKATP